MKNLKTLSLLIYFSFQLTASETICLVGDVGTGKASQYEVVNALLKEECTQVRLLGDLVYFWGINSLESNDFDQKFLTPFLPLLNKGVKLYLTLGNHDYLGSISPWLKLASIHSLIHLPRQYYHDRVGDLCFTTFDTNTKQIREEQYQWQAQDIGFQSESCAFKIALGHHPYFSSGRHNGANKNRKKFLNDLVLGKYDFYIAGHEHQMSYEGELRGTKLFVSGAGAKTTPMKRRPKGGFGVAKLGILVLKQLSDNKIILSFKDTSNSTLFEKEYSSKVR